MEGMSAINEIFFLFCFVFLLFFFFFPLPLSPFPLARAVRGVVAYRKLRPRGDYTMIAVEPTSIKPAEQHAAANGIPADKTILLQMYIKSPDDLALVLAKAEHFDFLGGSGDVDSNAI